MNLKFGKSIHSKEVLGVVEFFQEFKDFCQSPFYILYKDWIKINIPRAEDAVAGLVCHRIRILSREFRGRQFSLG